MEFGKNVKLKADGKTGLIITMDLSKELGPSSSGASILVASGHGPLGQSGIRMGLNAYFKQGASFNKKGLDLLGELNGENVEWEVDGTILTLKCDLGQEPRESKTGGKGLILATTKGNKKVGKSNIQVGLNLTVTADKKDKIDLSKICADTPASNMKLEVDKKVLKVIVDFSKECQDKVKGGGKYLIASSLGGYQCPKPFDDLKITLNITSAKKEVEIDPEDTPQPVNEKSKGVTYTVSKKKIVTFYIDTTNDFGETSSGLSTTVGQTSGKMAACDASCTMSIYRRDPNKKAEPKAKEVKESGTKRKATAPYDKVKAAVKDYMDEADGDLTVGTIRRAVCKKMKWDDEDAAIKSLIKKAINECQEEDDGDEEEADE
eukprot:TRINITY_DN21135_c0_g1_i1.p1 TRINITY_DN21135_c0_g1~~TRINITY_DN21135_c0_g1_i1.p1  ORF type:complete len:387 (+),score=108.07 TRINITY_DN21135_c0_g1_i1:36-1163(+)